MPTKNSEQEHFFTEGWRIDSVNNAESAKTYFLGFNGRLYSNNGKLSFSSIEGTLEVFYDERIIKYLGYTAFKDELILLVKVKNQGDFGIEPDTVSGNDITYPSGNTENPTDPQAVDFSDLYELLDDGYYGPICNTGTEPEPLGDVIDAFVSITKVNNILVGKYLWIGDMNWSITSKIVTIGVHENNSFKRIYFTDFLNTLRVVNILNNKIPNLSAHQFNVFQEFSLSEPLIEEIQPGGSLKSGIIFYVYRLLSDDGQRTVFSDLSERAVLTPGSTPQDIRGGDVSEDTGKKVKVKIINGNIDIYNKIEVAAIVYEAEGVPTSIKSIGVQDIDIENVFYHTGTEVGYDLNITLSDVTLRSGGWRYCSDMRTKKNKLIATGLRNTPLPFTLKDIEKDFILRAFSKSGSTYNQSFINPDPKTYRFIPKNGNIGEYKKKKTYIHEIKAFGSFIFTLTYQNITFSQSFAELNTYNDMTEKIWSFIDSIRTNFPMFYFTYVNSDIVIAPVSTANLDDLVFDFSTPEITIDANFDYEFVNSNISSQLIHGFQSYGFSKGNGIRITFKPEFQEIMEKSGEFMSIKHPDAVVDWDFTFWDWGNIDDINSVLADSYNFNRQNLFNLKENKFKRGCFKGEIYRLGLQFERSGENIFVLPIGDIYIPEIGENILGLTNEEITVWANSRKKGDILESILTNLLVDIRLNCEMREIYTSIKVVYVQRTPENRTIVCQGLAAPLVRYNQFNGTSIQMNNAVAMKWQLPFMGGPGIDVRGVWDYNTFGENMGGVNGNRGRTIVHRKLMYFDSPEILFDRIPVNSVQTGKIQVVAKVWPDHQGSKTLGHGKNWENGASFSQKIHSTIPVTGRNSKPGANFPNPHGLVGDGQILPNWVNVSVFSEASYVTNKTSTSIYKSKMMAKGEILSGSYLDVAYEISNNALTLFQPVIFYSDPDRYPDVKQGNTTFEGWKSNRHCMGARTLFLKSQDDIFTEQFFDGTIAPCSHEGTGWAYTDAAFVKHAVINIIKENADTVYGGRTELAYSRNVFIPMSKTLPIPKDSNRTMRIQVQGDTYCSMFFNNKTQYADYGAERIRMNHAGGGDNGIDQNKDYDDVPKRTGAWAYGVVLESTVDITLAKGLKFYQNSGAVDMRKTTDTINEVYFQEGTLRKYISKPVDFKDDPDLLHIIAVSEPKVMGSPVDNWTDFKINNFYELEKNMGAAYNLARNLDDIFAIQERQTSRLYLNERTAVNSAEGQVLFKTGDGTGVDGHKVVSDYGTGIRRSVTEIMSSIDGASGFYFYDEIKNEIVKNTEGILLKEDLAYHINKLLENNKVYDVEGYYDDLNKETVIRTRTQNGQFITYSYNELLKVMNGRFEYDHDQYFVWNNEVFAPKLKNGIVIHPRGLSAKASPTDNTYGIEQLNKGPYLKISGDDKLLKIGVTTNISPTTVKIFTAWMANINIDYPVERIFVKTSSGQEREILGTHHRYKIREGLHTAPLKNRMDWADLRGEWMELTVEIKNRKNKKIDIFSITNFVRESYL